MENRFIKKTFIYLIGNFSSKLLSALLIPIYAYFVSTEDLGNYDYIIALMNIIIPIVFFNMWDSILKYAIADNKKEYLKKIFTTAFLLILFNILIFVVLYLVIYFLGIINYPSYKLSMIMMLSYGLVTLWQYCCRALQKNTIYAISGVISTLVNLILIVLLVVVLNLGLNGLLIAYAVSMIISLILIESKIHLFSYINIQYFDLSLLKKMFTFSAPIVLNTVSLWGMNGISKIICVNYLSASANGLFSFASKFGSLITVVGSIIGAVIIEEAYLVNDLNEYKIKFSKIINTIFSTYIFLLWMIIPIVNIIFDFLWMNNVYYASKGIIPLVTLSAIFSSVATNFGSAFQITEKTIYVFFTSLIGSISSILISLLLIDGFGIIGLSLGQMLGSFILMLSRSLFAYRLTGLTVKWKSILFQLLVLLFIVTTSLSFSVTYNVILVFVVIIIIIIQFKNDVLLIINKLLKGN